MSRTSKVVIGTAVIAAVGVVAYVAVVKVQEKKALAQETAGNIQSELDALDPITRAAVVAKLSSDAAKDLKSRTGRTK